MKTKHTQGQWITKGDFKRIATNESLLDETQICIISGDSREEEIQANAQLIAAAPELLQMVYNLMKCVHRLTDDSFELHQEDKDNEAQWIGEAHELLLKINPNYYKNANS